jgi:hypothetical protein
MEIEMQLIKYLLFLGLDILGNLPSVFTSGSSDVISNQTVDGQSSGRT